MSTILRDDPAEAKADRLAAAVFEMWRVSMVQQTEGASMLNGVVTNNEPRVPSADEVRGFLYAAVRGAIVKKPPLPKSRARKIIDYLTVWE